MLFQAGTRNGARASISALSCFLIGFCCVAFVGCNHTLQSVAGSGTTAQPGAASITLQGTLPAASVGAPYNAVLSVSGGMPPYFFEVNQGSLPPGLALSAGTGSISGYPTKAGNFPFTIVVSSGPLRTADRTFPKISPENASRAFTLTVAGASQSGSNLRITTANIPAASLGVPYLTSLSVSGGKAPYRWSLSSGSLPNGLALIPGTGIISGSPANPGTVTFTVSVSDSSSFTAEQKFQLPVTGSQQQCGPPNYCARQDMVISQPETPVFNMGGLSGAGTCYVPKDFGLPVCRLTDANWDPSKTAGNTFSPIGANNHFFSCNHNLIFFGSSDGNGYVAALSAGSTAPYMSISHVYPSGAFSAHGGWISYSDSGAWSWNCAETPNLLFLKDPTQVASIVGYDFTGYASHPSGAPVKSTVFNFAAGSSGSWGTTSSNCLPANANSTAGWAELFGTSKAPADQIFEMAFSLVQGIAPGVDTVSVTHGSTAFTISGPTRLDTGGSLTHAQIFIGSTAYAIASVSSDGMSGTLTTPYSGTTATGRPMTIPNDQGTGMDIAIYKPGSGCAHLNVGTGVITSDFGPSGTMSTSDRFYLHGARISPDGTYVFMSTDACVPGTCSAPNNMGYIWNTSTLEVSPLCSNPNLCGGHQADGFTHIVNQGGQFPQSEIRPFSMNAKPTNIISTLPDDCAHTPIDTHLAWQDVDPADSFPFILTSVAFNSYAQAPGSYNCPLVNEVFSIDPTDGTIHRFAHTMITGQNWNYVIQNAIGQVSDDGDYFMFGSDWNGTLGRFDLRGGSCVNSPAGPGACRGDVFMVNLAAVPAM